MESYEIDKKNEILKEKKLRYVGHLGGIFYNFSLLAILLCFAFSFMPILWVVLLITLVFGTVYILILTMGMIMLSSWFINFIVFTFQTLFSDNAIELLKNSDSYIPLVASISGITILITIALLAIDRNRPSSNRKFKRAIIIACIFLGLMLYLLFHNAFAGVN